MLDDIGDFDEVQIVERRVDRLENTLERFAVVLELGSKAFAILRRRAHVADEEGVLEEVLKIFGDAFDLFEADFVVTATKVMSNFVESLHEPFDKRKRRFCRLHGGLSGRRVFGLQNAFCFGAGHDFFRCTNRALAAGFLQLGFSRSTDQRNGVALNCANGPRNGRNPKLESQKRGIADKIVA